MVILIAKDGKDPHLLKNYRPISLLNIDYKILSKVLATRLKDVLEDIISVDQIGFMNGRTIGEAIRIIDDVIFHATQYDLPGYMIAIDFQKAFDSVSHDFLNKILNFYNFGPQFCRWVEILYKNSLSCIFNGGMSTGYFEVRRGVRQGDPLSPLIFTMCM